MFRVFLEAAHRAGTKQGTSCIAASSTLMRIPDRPLSRVSSTTAVLCCPENGKGEVTAVSLPGTSFGLLLLLLLTNHNQSASHILARRGQTLGRYSGAPVQQEVLADLVL